MTEITTYDPGMAERTTEDFTKGTIFAANGERLTDHVTVGATAVAKNEVIAISSGLAVAATDTAAGEAVGIALHAAAAGEPVNYYFTGDYFMDALVWDASLNTDAKRKAAFAGSASPTQITLQKSVGAAALV